MREQTQAGAQPTLLGGVSNNIRWDGAPLYSTGQVIGTQKLGPQSRK